MAIAFPGLVPSSKLHNKMHCDTVNTYLALTTRPLTTRGRMRTPPKVHYNCELCDILFRGRGILVLSACLSLVL